MQLKLDNKERKELLNFIPKEHKLYKKIEKSMNKIKPRSAKNKGLNWQKDVCEIISELTGIPTSQDDDALISSRTAGLNGTDIILRGDASKMFPYSVECKNCGTISLGSWIEQAKQNETCDKPYLLFIKSPAIESKECVVMGIDTFKKLFGGK